MTSIRDLIKKPDYVPPRPVNDFFWKMFETLRLSAINNLTKEQVKELGSLTQSDQDVALDLMAEKEMVSLRIVPPSWRYMVWCEACKNYRPLPVKRSTVSECGWCVALKAGR